MKKIVITMLVFVVIFLIYYFNIDKNIYYFSIGDYLSAGINNYENYDNGYSINIKNYYKDRLSNYINYSNIEDYRVMDLINDINYNKIVKTNKREYKIQNILIKANYITLSIGMNDIKSKRNITYDFIDELINDIEKLFILIRKYNKDRIDYLGFYNIINNKELIDYTNNRLKKICNENKINYIDIGMLNSYMINSKYPTSYGYDYITKQILTFTKK